jgi:hypothetical protein
MPYWGKNGKKVREEEGRRLQGERLRESARKREIFWKERK